ncbi:MAG: CBS and ACT domain-containing protein [Anaerolineae bacterium]|nr:CBS and ACT domain-containing protein [Anaerolineae bacterium]
MLVNERMSHPVITVSPDTPIMDALRLMESEHIRRAPVVKDGKLVGIVAQKDLLNASPSPVTSLSVWEIHDLVSKITVKRVMTPKVITIQEDTPLEEAARLMADHRIGGLPVLHGDKITGIITETDLFKVFLELLGAREKGVRLSMLMENQPGEIAKVSQAIFEIGGNIVALGAFAGDDLSTSLVTMKVVGPSQEQLKTTIEPLVVRLKDIRTC